MVLEIDGIDVDEFSSKKIRVSLNTKLAIKNNLLVHYRSSSAKAKDKFVMYFQQLVVQVWQQQAIANNTESKDEHALKLQQVTEIDWFIF